MNIILNQRVVGNLPVLMISVSPFRAGKRRKMSSFGVPVYMSRFTDINFFFYPNILTLSRFFLAASVPIMTLEVST
jgi:hypothetical protein